MTVRNFEFAVRSKVRRPDRCQRRSGQRRVHHRTKSRQRWFFRRAMVRQPEVQHYLRTRLLSLRCGPAWPTRLGGARHARGNDPLPHSRVGCKRHARRGDHQRGPARRPQAGHAGRRTAVYAAHSGAKLHRPYAAAHRSQRQFRLRAAGRRCRFRVAVRCPHHRRDRLGPAGAASAFLTSFHSGTWPTSILATCSTTLPLTRARARSSCIWNR